MECVSRLPHASVFCTLRVILEPGTYGSGVREATMEERIVASLTHLLLPRCARILKPGTYGSPVTPPS
jgi:hypothetical protein